MKKFLALALVVAFAIAIMPATLAAPAAKADVKLNGSNVIDRPFSNTAIDQNGNVLNANELRGSSNRMVQTTSNEVNPKYLETETFNTNASSNDVKLWGIELIDPSLVHERGYWLTKADGDFIAVNDFYTNQQREMFLQKFTAATETGNRLFEAGETVFFNYDLYQNFSETEGFVDLPENEDGYDISVIVVGGVMEADGSVPGAEIAGEYRAESGISLQFTAPADDFVYIFYIIIDEVATLTGDFGAWLEFSSIDGNIDNVPKGADMKVGEYTTSRIGTSSSKAVVLPMNVMYRPAYAEAHKIELVGGEHYVLHVESTSNVGAHVIFADENFDVIADTWIAEGALEYGYTYDEIDMNVWPAVSGSYYIIVAGYSMLDEGELDVLVDLRSNFGYTPINDQNVAINLNDLGSESFVADDETWAYVWSSVSNVGELILAYPGTYTITGDNTDVIIDAYDGVKVVLDNSTSGGILALNNFASVAIEAKGTAKIVDDIIGYAISNVYGNNAGIYLIGEQLTIEGYLFGIIMEDAPLHIATKKLIVDTQSAEGYYPIAIWVIGAKLPELTLGGDAAFNGANRKAAMYYDAQEIFAYGYTVADQDALYQTESPKWSTAVLGFELTTNGSIADGGDYIVGDANGDGKVNTGDATMILKYVAELVTLEGTNLQAADMNKDGKVNTGDATAVLKFVVGQ